MMLDVRINQVMIQVKDEDDEMTDIKYMFKTQT